MLGLMNHHKYIMLTQIGTYKIFLLKEVKLVAKKYKLHVEIMLECKKTCMEVERVNKVTNVTIENAQINNNVMEEMILHLAQNMKIVALNFIVICPKIIHFYHNAKFCVLLMNNVVKPGNVDRVFIVVTLMLGWDHYTTIGNIMQQYKINSMRTMVL